jgi:hypothetical protein
MGQGWAGELRHFEPMGRHISGLVKGLGWFKF